MNLNEEYCRAEEKDKKDEKGELINKDKISISNDSFAICDFIEQLTTKLEQLRVSSLMKK